MSLVLLGWRSTKWYLRKTKGKRKWNRWGKGTGNMAVEAPHSCVLWFPLSLCSAVWLGEGCWHTYPLALSR